MGTLGGRQAAGHRLGLSIVLPAIALLEPVDGRQDELRPEAARQPGERAGAPAEPQPPGPRADAVELLAPEFGMPFLDRGEPAVDFPEAGIGFRVGQRTIERGTVDLASQIGAVARRGIVIGHRRHLRGTA